MNVFDEVMKWNVAINRRRRLRGWELVEGHDQRDVMRDEPVRKLMMEKMDSMTPE